MELKHNDGGGSVCDHDQLLPLSGKYPWFVTQNLEVEKDNSIFYTIHDPFIKYQCRQTPEMLERHIRGYFHGWVILSFHPQNVEWSLWNPVTSKVIHLPPLILEDGDLESIAQCCLSAPPDDPTSVLLLTRTNKTTFVFCHLGSKRKKLRWTETSYAKQLKKIIGEDNLFLESLVCCNGKVYALNVHNTFGYLVIQIDIVIKDEEVLITSLLLGLIPFSFSNYNPIFILEGLCTDLYLIELRFNKERLERVHLYRLDMTSLKSEEIERFKGLDMTGKDWKEMEDYSELDMSQNMWEELLDLNDAIFFVDLARNNSVYYKPEIASELGGYIHIRDRSGKNMYTYHFKDKTVSLSCMPSIVLLTSNVPLWERRLEDGHGEAKCTTDFKQEEDQILVKSFRENEVEFNECHLLNLPLHILETIMEHCVCVEYMNFRGTCKRCHVAAPLIQWSNETALRRLQTYSLISPWLMEVDCDKDNITFTDPMLGESYFMKNLPVMLADEEEIICCSRFGWLLFRTEFTCLAFFNPFTGDLHKLPPSHRYLKSVCFSAPPTSPDCMVVGFSSDESPVYIHHVAREPSWRILGVGFDTDSIHFSTFFGRDLYGLRGEGVLIGIKDLVEEDSATFVEFEAPLSCSRSSSHYYLMRRDQDLIEVIVGEFGVPIEVFKWNDSQHEWEKVHSLGKYMIYICDTTCLCIEAKTTQMENKIYFPLRHSKNGKIVFYSLETHTYHTFIDENVEQHSKDFTGTTYNVFHHAWIEPSW